MKGGIGWQMRSSAVDRDLRVLSDVPVSRINDIKLCQNYTKTHI